MTATNRWWRLRGGAATDFAADDVFAADQVINVTGSGVVRLADGVSRWADLPRIGAPGECPEDYGALGDGVTNDTVAIMAADTAARSRGTYVQFGPKTYRGNLTLKRGSDWRGAGFNANGVPGSRIRAISGTPAVRLNPDEAVYQARLTGVVILGEGAPAVFKDDLHQHDGIIFTNCEIASYAGGAFRVLGGISSVTLDRCTVFGSPVGIDLEIDADHVAAMDWWRIVESQIGGVNHGLRFRAVNAGGHGWLLDRVRFSGHPSASHTVLLAAWTKHWTWRNVVAAEAQGGGDWGTGFTFTTTATATAGQSTATLADSAPIAPGQRLTIRGAGGSGDHYEGVVLSKSGATVTLDTPIATSVANAACTNATADILHCGNDYGVTGPWIGRPLGHVFIGCDMGRGAGSVIRYSISDGGTHVFINHETYNAPIRDPYQSATVVGPPPQMWSSSIRASASDIGANVVRWDAANNRPLFSDGVNWRTAAGAIVT